MFLGKLAHTRTILIIIVATAAGLLVTSALTTPDQLGPFGITLWFLGLLVLLAGIISLALYRFRTLVHHGQDKQTVLTRSLRQGVLASTWLTALVALNSLRQLGFKDLILVTILVWVIDFYLRRLTPA